ncbi:RNA-binding protein 41 [Microtus ochrogaster]|uniref:RNA-binding protein 41 n=1 Tax=Microtus ochrogaster TaxID=79684 RepID=A0A8J6G7T8_MICOH|nr:RNA-binding protein 41 [Microtus ochrogaster]
MNNLESFYHETIMKKRLEEFQLMRGEPFASHSLVSATSVGDSGTAENPSLLQDKGKQAAQGKGPSLHVAKVIDFPPEQCWTGPKKLTQPIEFIPEDEIQRNRLSEEEIRNIPMFSSYNPGEPNKVLYLKNLSPRVKERDLISLFARFQEKKGPPIQFQIMTGRMRGQAFITFPNKDIAWQALHQINGYKLHGKILVIEFGKNKQQQPAVQGASLITSATDSSAEISDNAVDPDVSARTVFIDVEEVKNKPCLTFTDDGCGMTPHKLHRMLSFGFTDKVIKKSQCPIGVFGNGFKSGSMRLGKDALVFTKNGGTLTVGLLSQTYLECIQAQAVIVPIVPFSQQSNILPINGQ